MSFTYEQTIDLNINCMIDSILQEMYKKPILDIIDKFVDDILNNIELSETYGKYRMYITFVDPNTKIKKQKNGKMSKYDPIEDIFVYKAAYDQLNYIYKFEIRDDLEEIYDAKNRLKQELKEIYVHENTHEQQNQLKHRLQPYDDGDGDLIDYLSQYQEIAAMARGVAYALESRVKFHDEKDLIRSIASDSKKLDKLPIVYKSTIRQYRQIGGKVWKEFLKHVYLFFFYDPEAHGTVEYRKWLKEHFTLE
jgi:hypothetical protein